MLNIFEKVKPLFTEGGKLALLKPLYEAKEHFFFAPSATTLNSPLARDAVDLKRYMSMVILALLPCVFVGVFCFGLRVLVMIMVSYIAGGIVEVAFAVIRKEPIAEGFLVTGLIFPLILPPMLPLWMVALGAIIGVILGKALFGGTGRNLFNPAIVGRCFLSLACPSAMSGNWVKPSHGLAGRLLDYVTISNAEELHAIAKATPLATAKAGVLIDTSKLVIGEVAGSIGETSGLLIIFGGLFLLLTRVANWRTVAGSLGAAFATAAILHHINPDKFAPAVWHLFAGGLLFGSFFMATDPVTSPITGAGKWVYGILIGVLTMLFRNFTGFVEGVTFAILLGNIVAPLLDKMVYNIRIKRLASEG